MSIFINKKPIVINTQLALLIGLEESLILQQLHFWIEINRKAKKNFINGYYWTYNTFENWQKNNFPFWSLSTVIRNIGKLEKRGLLITETLNKKAYDRTKWYRIDYSKINELKLTNQENTADYNTDYMNIFYNEDPLLVNVELAEVVGLNESIVLQQIHYWIEINKLANNNFKNNYYWTYNTFLNWQKNNFPFWSVRTIKTIINKLENDDLIINDNFNTNSFDRTKWYRINYEKVNINAENIHSAEMTNSEYIHSAEMNKSVNMHSAEMTNSTNMHTSSENSDKPSFCHSCTMDSAEMTTSFCHSCTMDSAEMTRPIPETNTETNDRDFTTTTTSESIENEVRVVVVNNCIDDSFVKETLVSDITYNSKLISNELAKNNFKLSKKQIESLLNLANNNVDIIIRYIKYMVSRSENIVNKYGYLKSLIINHVNLKEDVIDENKIKDEEDRYLLEQIEIINKKLLQNNINLDRKQVKDLLELAQQNGQVVLMYIDYMLSNTTKIESVYAYLKTAILKCWDTTKSNYNGKPNPKNPNKIVNYTGRTWDFEKINELEQAYLEDSVKDM